MMLEVLKTSAKPDALIDELIGVTRELIRQTRELARSLCPVDLAGEGLPKALEQLATSSHLYYISCEAVNNALKHAQSERIVISLQGGSDGLTLSIEDDGIGLPADPPVGGMGLRTMGYRASAIGVVLSIRRARKAGTIVECYWPYRNAAMKLKSEVRANATR